MFVHDRFHEDKAGVRRIKHFLQLFTRLDDIGFCRRVSAKNTRQLEIAPVCDVVVFSVLTQDCPLDGVAVIVD